MNKGILIAFLAALFCGCFQIQAQYNSVGISGSAVFPEEENPWAPEFSLIRSTTNPDIWYADNVALDVGEFKFRANGNYDVNWGQNGTNTALYGTLVQGGGNISISTSGTYQVTINTSTGSFVISTGHLAIGIAGSATNVGWDPANDVAMTQDANNAHLWKITDFSLSGGELKFRANNSWGINWGGNSLNGTGEFYSTTNVPINLAGFYDLTFNDLTWEYEIVKLETVTLDPASPSPEDEVTITYNANIGNGVLAGSSSVYIHTGVVTSDGGTSWEYVQGNWGTADANVQMTQVAGESNKWEITLSPDIRSFYGVPAGTPTFRLSMVFRNEAGDLVGKTADNTDFYLDIDPGDYILIDEPQNPNLFVLSGGNVDFSASASEGTSSFKTYVGGVLQQTDTDGDASTTFTYSPTADETVTVTYEAEINGVTLSRSATYHIVIRNATVVEDLPAGTPDGPSYNPSDNSEVTLSLIAPNKEYAYVIGDFNNWTPSNANLMKKTSDGERFWITLSGLTPGQDYVYQYLVDGEIRIGDPFAEQVADPYQDGDIPSSVFPNLPSYSDTNGGRATVFRTGQTDYSWNFPEVAGPKPDKADLMIYELLVRDFTAEHSYQSVIDNLPYLKELGINVLELMPVNEFEFNTSWGYNPNYYFAPDKYYGTKAKLKEMIDKCHKNGINVVIDMVLNHSFNSSPFVQLYYNELLERPASDNPWHNEMSNFNNPDAQWGSDFNQESDYTKALVDSVNQYWLEEYKVDGFRFDFTKGFSNTPWPNSNCGDQWGGCYDQARIDNLKRMYDKIMAVEPNAYVILEHFAPDDEEKILADYGMLLWGNLSHAYQELVLGNTADSDLSRLTSDSRGFAYKHLIGFMESHDEERLMYKALEYGFQEGSYNIKDLNTALERVKTASAFFYTVPGPKMLYQFNELGYDYSINYNGRTGEKPIVFRSNLNYDQDPERMKVYKVMAALMKLRNEHQQAFREGGFNWIPGGQFRRLNVSHGTLNLTVVANFGTTAGNVDPNFQFTGEWFDFFAGGTPYDVFDVNSQIFLNPGEFKVFVDRSVSFPETGLVETNSPFLSNHEEIRITATGGGSQAMLLIKNNLWEIGNYQYDGGTFQFDNNLATIWGDEEQDGTAEEGSSVAIDPGLPVGNYNIRFDDQTLTYTISTVRNREMYLRGQFNSWEAAPMTLVAEDTWQINDVNFTADEFKFSNTSDWLGRNYGNSGENGNPGKAGNLDPGAADVATGITTPYHYTVTFNDESRDYLFLAIPANMAVTPVSATELSLSWEWPENAGNLPNAQFEIQRSTDNFTDPANTTIVTTISDPAARSFVDTGLSAGSTYYYRVRAVNP